MEATRSALFSQNEIAHAGTQTTVQVPMPLAPETSYPSLSPHSSSASSSSANPAIMAPQILSVVGSNTKIN